MTKEIKLPDLEIQDTTTWTDPAWRASWIAGIAIFLLNAIIFLTHTNEEIGDSALLLAAFYLMIPVAAAVGVLEIIDLFDRYAQPENSATQLHLDEQSIKLFGREIETKSITKVIIRLRQTEKVSDTKNDNFLEINTLNNHFKMRLIIRSVNGIKPIKEVANYFMANKIDVIYDERFS